MTSLNCVTLRNGIKMPLIGLGTWKSKPNQTANAVKKAIDIGYRHIDCAPVYGNEVEVGVAIKSRLDNVIDRQDLFITSKLWNTMHARKDVRTAVEKTLSDLQLDYLDLYLIHFPTAFDRPTQPDVNVPRNADGSIQYSDIHYLETWKGMEDLVEADLVKAIGTSNFNSKQLNDIIHHCKIPPAVNQVESHPYHNQKRLIEFCTERNIVVTAYAPLGSTDRPWAKPDEKGILHDPKVIELAYKYSKSPAQILLRYQVQRQVVAIPKSVTSSRIQENIQVFDFSFTNEDMQALNELNKEDNQGRLCWCSWTLPVIKVDGKLTSQGSKNCPFYPFHEPF